MDRIISLTTDFGLKDPYLGAMKGALLSINPGARISDITHLVTPGDIVEGAFVLLEATGYYPKGTIHVGVVDPGVGGDRRPVLIETERFVFIGPDNGLLSLAAEKDGIKRTIHLLNNFFFLNPVSATFHGRDIFAPVAAHISNGVEALEMGQAVEGPKGLDLPKPERLERGIKGEVIYVDSFGNLITNIGGPDALSIGGGEGLEVRVGEFTLKGLQRTYCTVKKGEPVALIGSSGRLELAVNMGMASKVLKAGIGEKVTVMAAAI